MIPFPSASIVARRFNPLADPDLVGLWVAGDATDNGSTLTVPNRKAGGAAATATGAGRPTVSGTALDGMAPGIVIQGSSAPLSAAITLSGKTQCTIYCLAQNSTTTGATDVWMYGNAVQRLRMLYHDPIQFNVEVIRSASPSDATTVASRFVGGFTYPTVSAFRFNTARAAPGENLPIWMDARSVSSTQTNAAETTGSLGGGSLFIGCTYGGGSYFQGRIGAFAVIGREHTDAEVARWTAYLRSAAIGNTSQAKTFMWCGDSITVGIANNGGFRVKIQSLYDARSDGKRFYRTIGPNTGGYYLQDRYCAVSGQTINDLATNIAAALGPTHDYHPDVIPILIGTNDIGVGPGLSGMDTRYGALLDSIAALEPNALIVAQALLPRSDGFGAAVTTWNTTMLPGVVAAAQARGVNVILDTTASTTPGIVYSDGLHPTAAGYDTIGTALEPRTRAWVGVT